MTDQPGLSYDEFAAEFANRAAEGAYNALYDRPAVLEAAGEMEGFRVLDLGCGPGLYAAEMTSKGATVVGVDESQEMVRLARESVPTARFEIHDLNQSLDWLEDQSFDLAVMALVIHHLDNRRLVLDEVHRLLRPGGRLVLSTHHPTSDWYRLGGSYFEVGRVTEIWQDKLRVQYWRQPLQATCDEFLDAGFLIERIVEPKPSADLQARFPEEHIKLSNLPGFIVFSLAKPPIKN
jgi:SAM-dependent methyltransferase